MILDTLFRWKVPLIGKPEIALITLGTHGPHLTEQFRSDRFWWLHLYRYTATLRLNGQVFPIHPNCVSLIAPGTDIEYDFDERATHLCAHFRLPPTMDAKTVFVPAMQNLGMAFPALYQTLEEAAVYLVSNPLRAEVRLWDILWQLAQEPDSDGLPPQRPYPAAFQQARQIIERRLGEPLSVAWLASEVDISHNHLTRLFRKTTGETVIGYIRMRRVERARHLLMHTTLPIKSVAVQVGVEDVRQFYKLIRAYLGQSPSQVRQRGNKMPEDAE